jgi:hypothetical protein
VSLNVYSANSLGQLWSLRSQQTTGNGITPSSILNLWPRRKEMVTFPPRPLYSWINNLGIYWLEEYLILRFSLDATEKKPSRYLSEIEPRFVGHSLRTFFKSHALIGTADSCFGRVLITFRPRMPYMFLFGLIHTYPIQTNLFVRFLFLNVPEVFCW